jgi:hypothetical protein
MHACAALARMQHAVRPSRHKALKDGERQERGSWYTHLASLVLPLCLVMHLCTGFTVQEAVQAPVPLRDAGVRHDRPCARRQRHCRPRALHRCPGGDLSWHKGMLGIKVKADRQWETAKRLQLCAHSMWTWRLQQHRRGVCRSACAMGGGLRTRPVHAGRCGQSSLVLC